MWRLWIIVGLSLSACAEFPEVDAALGDGAADAKYPALLPFEQLFTAEEPRLDETDDDELRARADALRARAAGIRGPVIDRRTRDRMNEGVTHP